MEKSKKRTIIQAIVCIGLLCVIWSGYFLVRNNVVDKMFELCNDDFSWIYQIDSLHTEADGLVLDGFAFELGKDAEKGRFEIVLQEMVSGEYYYPEMEYGRREDVNEYFLCEYDYAWSGFSAFLSKEKINVVEYDYEVLLRVSGEKKAFKTNIHVLDGRLVCLNYGENVSLEVEDTDLEEVVERGKLQVCRPDVGIYIYQYKNELYWIADESFIFEGDDTTYVSYQISTTQEDKIPKNKVYDNLTYEDGAIFEGYEIDGDFNGYRVSVRTIPTEFAVTKIRVGYYKDRWIWSEKFRPLYEIK